MAVTGYGKADKPNNKHTRRVTAAQGGSNGCAGVQWLVSGLCARMSWAVNGGVMMP